MTMRIAFLCNNNPPEIALARKFIRGAQLHGDRVRIIKKIYELEEDDCDVLVFIGLKGHRAHAACQRVGRRFIYIDKGYYYPKEKYMTSHMMKMLRVLSTWRIAIDCSQPLDFLRRARYKPTRWQTFGPKPKPWREPRPDAPIILAGSSCKYHQFYGLPPPTEYFEEVIAELRRHTDRPIHYRPKPSWRDAVPIDDTEFTNTGSFEERCAGAHAVITHGSNASLIAMISGVPSINLGPAVMSLISSTKLSEIENLYLATDAERMRLLSNIAHSQYTLQEFETGWAWPRIKRGLA